MSDNERFKKVVQVLAGGDLKEFERQTAVPYTTVRNYLSRGSKPGAKVIAKIKEGYPNFNSAYLIEGASNILLSNEAGEPEEKYSITKKGIPYFDLDITAGEIPVYLDRPHVEPEHHINIFGFNDCTHAFPVYGHSMHPVICNGDVGLFKYIRDKSIIMWGSIYLVITKDYRTIKFLRKSHNSENVILRSHSANHDDIEIPRDDILELFLYKGKIERTQM